MINCEIVVTGKVQGVGFRRFVFNQAKKLQISGYVQNRYNGDVYILARGEKMAMKAFIEIVKKGNLFSRVKDLTSITIPLDDNFRGFSIK